MFTLCEELLLLSVHEAKGTFIGSTFERLKAGLAGAILAELALAEKIQVSPNHRLRLVDDSQANDDVLNDALAILKESKRERKLGYWINTLGQRNEKIRKQVIAGLLRKGVASQDDERLVWVVPSPLQPETKSSTKYLLNKRLRGLVLAQEETQPSDIVLLSLVRACGLLDLVFLSDERKLAGKIINELFYGKAINDPVIQAIQEIEEVIAALVEED